MLTTQHLANDIGVAVARHTKVWRYQTVGMKLGILDKDFLSFSIDRVITIDRKAASLIETQARAQPQKEGGRSIAITCR
ncbi:hypothetical protein ACFQDN_16405 [Pseudomonas asuensis]